MSVPLSEQIAEVKRELALRRNVYYSWVRQRKMTQPQADNQIARMQAVLETLEGLEACCLKV